MFRRPIFERTESPWLPQYRCWQSESAEGVNWALVSLLAGSSAKLTFVITVCPSWWATKSFTALAGAFSSLLPPMKWSASLCFAAYDTLPLVMGTVPLVCGLAVPLTVAIVYKVELVLDEQGGCCCQWEARRRRQWSEVKFGCWNWFYVAVITNIRAKGWREWVRRGEGASGAFYFSLLGVANGNKMERRDFWLYRREKGRRRFCFFLLGLERRKCIKWMGKLFWKWELRRSGAQQRDGNGRGRATHPEKRESSLKLSVLKKNVGVQHFPAEHSDWPPPPEEEKEGEGEGEGEW